MSSPPSDDTKKKAAASIHGRSVVDYVDEKELLAALETVTPQGIASNDWMLPVPDPEAEEQTAEGEMARLLTLKSYLLLDAENEEAFDKLTEEAREIFGVPTSLISLVDLSRQFFFSNTGADVRETPRDMAFCSHTILNKKGIVVVNDTKEDERFKNNPLVTQAPFLRFYAGAPLISPEGHKLGAFCVEGPEPRPFSSDENVKLKEYAAKAVEMMVERRKNLRDRLAGKTVSNDLLRHASVATNLGDTMFHKGDSVTAMQLFQESVQTVMHQEEGKVEDKPNLGRHAAMADLLKKLSDPSSSDAATKTVMDKVRGLFPEKSEEVEATKKSSEGFHPLDGIPCLFNSTTKLKGMSAPRPLPPLVFADTFTIDLSDSDEEKGFPLDERQFTVSIGECSKATLFNMGLIHYYWCRPDTALQFFHLAASVSYKFNPLKFDPVDLTSANNMAQIYLQMRKPEEAKKMMASTLKRGNDLLSDLYKSVEPKTEQGDAEPDPESLAESMASDTDEVTRKTRRLRRKLARTLLNLGHVHFFNGDLDAAMKTCKDAIPLLDGGMVGLDLAASWFNMAMIFHYLSKNDEAISAVNRFLDVSSRKDLIDGDHVQKGDALQLKGECLYELGRQAESLEALTESLRIRRLKFGESSGMLVETLGLLGKVYLARNEVEPAITSLTQCLTIERSATTDATSTSITLSFEASQILLDLGRAHQIKGDIEASLSHYLQVLVWARSFFGATHVFVSRIATIVGNLYAQAGKLTESQQFLTEAAIIQASSG